MADEIQLSYVAPVCRFRSCGPGATGRPSRSWTATSQFKLVVRFDDAGDGVHTRIGITGHAHPHTRAALASLAAASGGPVGLAVGV